MHREKTFLFLLDVVVLDEVPGTVQPFCHHEGSRPWGQSQPVEGSGVEGGRSLVPKDIVELPD